MKKAIFTSGSSTHKFSKTVFNNFFILYPYKQASDKYVIEHPSHQQKSAHLNPQEDSSESVSPWPRERNRPTGVSARFLSPAECRLAEANGNKLARPKQWSERGRQSDTLLIRTKLLNKANERVVLLTVWG